MVLWYCRIHDCLPKVISMNCPVFRGTHLLGAAEQKWEWVQQGDPKQRQDKTTWTRRVPGLLLDMTSFNDTLGCILILQESPLGLTVILPKQIGDLTSSLEIW